MRKICPTSRVPLLRQALWLLLFCGVEIKVGAVPLLLNYQGRILAGSTQFDGVGQFKFALVSADGATTYWLSAADANGDREPDTAVFVPVSRGLYNVRIGDTTLANMAPVTINIFSGTPLFLRVWFSDGISGFERLSPDQQIVSVAFALRAETANAANTANTAITAATANTATTANSVAASGIVGTFSAAQVPVLDASKITSGVFNTARIPNLSAAVLTSGTLDPARLPANVALKNPDIQNVTAAIVALQTQVNALSAQVAQLASSVLVSSSATDATLVGAGYANFSSLPAPDWRNGAIGLQPSPRLGHAAIWTGSQFLVWGGQIGPNTFSSLGGFYSPTSDQWQPTTGAAAPSARMGHTLMWNGSAALIWGGFSETGFQNTGAKYDLATAAWSGVAMVNAPIARADHVGEFFAPFMVIWGGRNSSGLRNDGALYNISTDTWAPISVAGPPEARFGASSVVASDRVIVWGGLGILGPLNTGAQLIFQLTPSVAPLQWSATATANAPSPRTGHTAIMAGTKMIVWGGRNGGTPLGDGAIFDSGANTWQAVPTADAPSARYDHTAVWTGAEMIVLGGRTVSGSTASGAAFNPTTGRWRPLTNASALARERATSVWTGSEVLTFGGEADGVPLAALQRLNPQPTWFFYRKL